MKRINLKSLEPKIVMLPAIKLAAKSVTMSFSQDKTQELWKSFGPLIKSISHKVDNDRYSVQVYPDIDFFKNFDPTRVFKKYAAIEVTEYDNLPIDLEKLIIPEGLYAIFNYIGKPSEASETFRYILIDWLNSSKYTLSDRPHFCKMGHKYKGEEPDSEEELMIPISLKS